MQNENGGADIATHTNGTLETETNGQTTNNSNNRFPIIVIGASAGGFEALKYIVAHLPQNLGAAICIVWHMSPDVRGILPQVLNKSETLPAGNAYDGETIVENRIYVAPPNHHMLVDDGRLRVTNGPKENRFRPAIDPLFRSAAYSRGSNVIGIILSGALDDGTAGLWTVKHAGGVAVVQDPADAQVPSMPENAMREVKVDYCVPLVQMPILIQKLVKEVAAKPAETHMQDNEKEKVEIRIASAENAISAGVLSLGEPTIFTCPECHGVLSLIKEGQLRRFRCHTGHAFSPDSLLSALSESIEESLWNAIRSIEESTLLLNHFGDHFAEVNRPKLAAAYFQKARDAFNRSEHVRKVLVQHEQLNEEELERNAEEEQK